MITVSSLSYNYRPKIKVLDNLSTEFTLGATYGLLGKNGSGKSTLLRCLCGLLYPNSGNINISSFNPQNRQPDFLSKIFFIPEEIYLPNVAIKTYVNTNQWMYPKFDLNLFNQLLDEFEIPVSNNLQEMSYGQKKKLLISFALASNTDYLLMDEPTNGLDIISKSQFRKIMAGYMNDNRCVIISTHQLKDLEQLIDHICIIENGSIMLNESIEQISKILKFGFITNEMNQEDIIYTETMLTSKVAVTVNDTESDSIVDLELLYKAVLINPSKISTLFNK